MTAPKPVIAIVVPTAIYRCPRCNWQFLEDSCETDGQWWYCPNCNVRVHLPPVSTMEEEPPRIQDVERVVYHEV